MTAPADRHEPLAVVGMACRFPGATTPDEFWEMLRDGREPVTFFSDEELLAAGVPREMVADPDYVGAQGVVDGADMFDAGLFGLSPGDAAIMDPQHRVLLECAWAALEDAGHDPRGTTGPVGVFAGCYRNDHLGTVPAADEAAAFARNVAGEADYLATRVSFLLDLDGPSVTVQTACSTSLVAVHLACQSLWTGESRAALAGGVTVRAGQPLGYVFQPGGILSSDGRCRPFDARAEGTVIGDGVGLVVLKRLSDAIDDGDTVRALVLGSAVGNDGASRVGFTAPGVAGQARVVGSALRRAGVGADTIGYVETHGSATPLGDRIEVDALSRAFREQGDPGGGRKRCLLSSVKSNIGHTHAAAGVAGLVKAVLSLQHGQVPPTLHFETPNPRIDFASSPFRVAGALTPWERDAGLRRAGVSSFGLGGTGAHVVLQQPPADAAPERPDDAGPQVVVLSAQSEEALETARERLAARLRHDPAPNAADVAYTTQTGRAALAHRLAVVGTDTADLADVLGRSDPERMLRGVVGRRPGRVTFMFPGLGDQHAGMARGLYDTEPVFAAALDECDRLMRSDGGELLTRLFPEGADPKAAPDAGGGMDLRRMLDRGPSAGDTEPLRDTVHAQPAVFAVEYALARLWLHRGVTPAALIGYSLGEYVAACVSGVLSLPDAVRLVRARASLIAELPPGGMLAVPLPEDRVRAALGDGLSLSAVNGPTLCVVAGEPEAVRTLQDTLAADGVASRPLVTSHAFHSHMMEPIADRFADLVAATTLRPPRIPYLSNVTGDWITDEEATDPRYYARHLREAVRFVDGQRTLQSGPGDHVLLELGPGQVLGSLARQAGDGQVTTIGSLTASFDRRPDVEVLATATARLWLAGVPVDWSAVHGGPRRRLPLPTYPFERRDYGRAGIAPTRQPTGPAVHEGRAELDDWFYTPVWTPTAPLAPGRADGRRILLFCGEDGFGDRVAGELVAAGAEVVTVHTGPGFATAGPRGFVVRPDDDGDHRRLFDTLAEQGRAPDAVVHTWLVSGPDEPQPPAESRLLGLHHLFLLARTAPAPDPERGLDVTIVTSDRCPHGTGTVQPEKASVRGACLAWPFEAPGVRCRTVDVGPGDHRAIAAELTGGDEWDRPVSLRGSRRWVREHVAVPLDDVRTPAFRDGGVYLVTGGTGGIGRTLAAHLASSRSATVVLAGRSADPGTAPQTDGGWIHLRRADLTDPAQVRDLVRGVVEEFGALHGVVHAAGLPGGGLMALKDPAAADAVLAPKVDGALALRAACADLELDFVLYCSSLLAVTGGAGQSDYCAANAVLDALADEATARGGPLTVSVAWDAWREVGMSVDAALDGRRPVRHPLLDHRLPDTPEGAVVAGLFDASSSWLVDEHRMLGMPVVPGASHVELVRCAVAEVHGTDPVGVRDLTFLTPVVAGETDATEVRVVLGDPIPEPDDPATTGVAFTVVSAYRDGAERRWQSNSTGTALLGGPLPPRTHDPSALLDLPEIALPADRSVCGPMGFGPRSQCVESVRGRDTRFTAELRLPDEFAGELADLPLHPALLDLATAFVGLHVAEEFRIPLSYGRVEIRGPLRSRMLCHHVYSDRDDPARQTVTCDLTLTGMDGTELLRITDFVLKKTGDLQRRLDGARDGVASEIVPFTFTDEAGAAAGGRVEFLSRQLADGISPQEGMVAFERLLGAGLAPGVVVSTHDLATVIARARAGSRPDAGAAGRDDGSAGTGPDRHPRPPMSTAYAEPDDDVSRALAALWCELLGLEAVGLHDDFFELGGHSLLGIQLASRLRREFGLDIPMATLFEALTVARLREHATARATT